VGREELEALVRRYHHLQNEHKRASLESGVRRRIEERLLEIRARFDRVLSEWVADEELKRAWWEHLRHRAPEPDEPPAVHPLVFRGISEAGSTVEVRRREGDELEVWVDGALIERIAGNKDFAPVTAPLRVRLNGTGPVQEIFSVRDDALDALSEFLDGGSPPWEHASELLADGLVDVHLDLTPRGHRALASRES
jgi:hypothetical protein